MSKTEFNKELSEHRQAHLNTIIGYIEEAIGQPINKTEFNSHIKSFVNILHETLKACAKSTHTDRVNALLEIKDPLGAPILQGNRKWAEEIAGTNTEYGNRCEEFVKLNNEIIERHKALKNQRAGAIPNDENFKDMKSPKLEDELRKQIDQKLKQSPLRRTFEIGGNILVLLGRMVNPFYMYDFYQRYKLIIDPLLVIPKTILDMILFPLYILENIPVVGGIVGVPLDFVGIMIDSSDFLFKLIAPIVPGVIASIMDILKAIPLVGTVVSLVSIPLNFGMPIVQNLVSNLASIIGFFFSVARKNFSQAYFYAINFVPFMGSIMRLATRLLYTINRIMGYVNKTIDQVSIFQKLDKAFSDDRASMSDPLRFMKSFIFGNLGKSKTIDNIARRLIPYTPAVIEFNKSTKDKRSELIGAWPVEDIEDITKGGRYKSKRRRRPVRRRSK